MPKSAKRFFEPAASAKATTTAPEPEVRPAAPEAPPVPQAAAPAPQPSAPAQDPVALRAEFEHQEQQRRTAISNLFAGHTSQSDLMNSCLLDMSVTVDKAKDQLLDALGAQTTPTATVHVGNGDLAGDSVKASLLARAGLETAETGNRYNGFTLIELARAYLHDSGINASGNRMQIANVAFTHSNSDFVHILQDVAHKSVLKGYNEFESSFERFTNKGVLTDFRESHRAGTGAYPNLELVPEGAEYKYGTIGDTGEKIKLATYGSIFSITRQAIINDDLNELVKAPKMMGRAAKRTIANLVYEVLTSNPKMLDNKTLFHNDHKNLATAGAISVDALDAAMALMEGQKDGDAFLDIQARFLLVPRTMERATRALLAAELDPADETGRTPNAIRDMLEVIADPRLNGAGAAFLLADPSVNDVIEVGYLDGNDTPYLEEVAGFTTDGVAYKVRIDAGVAPMSWRTMVKQPLS